MSANIKQIFAPNQIFALAAKGIEGTKVVAINVAVARYFGPEVFGQFAFALGIVSLIAIIGEFKLINVLIQKISTEPELTGETLGSALALNMLFSLAGVSLLMVGGFLNIYEDLIFLIIVILSLGYIFKIPRAFKAFFVVRERNHLVTISEFIASIVCLVLIGSAIYFEGNILYVSILKGFDFLLVSLFLFYFYWVSENRQSLRPRKSISIDLVRAGLPLAISGFIMILFQRIDIFMIKFYLGDENVGFYTAATNYMMLFTLPGMVLTETLSPRLFKDVRHSARRDFLRTFLKVGCCLSLVMFLTSYYVIPAVFGNDYKASVAPALILSMAPLLICMGASAGQLIIKDGLQRHAVKKSIVACAVNVALNAYAIPKYGIVGAALSSVVSFAYAYYFGHFFVIPLRKLFFEQTSAFKKISFKI